MEGRDALDKAVSSRRKRSRALAGGIEANGEST